MNAYLVSVTTSITPVVPTAAEQAVITTLVPGKTWVGTSGQPESFHLYNPGPDVVYLGGSNVDVTNGFPLASLASVEIDLMADALYAVKSGAAQNVNVLRVS